MTNRTRYTTKPRVALAVVLVLSSIGVGLYALAAGLAAPTITSAPADPTNQTSATFKYSYDISVTFHCSLDGSALGGCGTGKSGTKSYSGLANGSHTFLVRAVSGSQTSDTASHTWTIDTSSPAVASIYRSSASPTNQAVASWDVMFSEPVNSVNAGDFMLVGGASGPPPAVTGSGASYVVSANTPSSGTMGLNLVDDDTIKDAAGNKLGGPGKNNGNFIGQVYAIDKVAPPVPVITQAPPDPSATREATFAWTDAEAGVTFRCRVDEGPVQACTSPHSFEVPTNGGLQHLFKVRAIDGATNESVDATHTWKVSGDDFEVSGDVCCLYPGVWRDIDVTITNPNGYAIEITSVDVAVGQLPAGCEPSWIEFQQSAVSSSNTMSVPAHSTVHLFAADRPRIRLADAPVNQDACQNQTFALVYGGTANH